jgi:putative endonuclease
MARAWKILLIEKDNPNWVDLYPEIAGIDGQASGILGRPVKPGDDSFSCGCSNVLPTVA